MGLVVVCFVVVTGLVVIGSVVLGLVVVTFEVVCFSVAVGVIVVSFVVFCCLVVVGFAVVASEISSLAKQTSDATISITELIEEIALSIDEVFKAINLMMESNKEQNKSAETMAANFENIEMSARNIYDLSDDLENVIRNLAKSNESIVESINNVSAITEEVSARANETLTDSEKDAQIVDEMASVFMELNEKAKKLNQ